MDRGRVAAKEDAMSPARTYRPAQARRLLVINPETHRWKESRFDDLVEWLKPGDALVVNDAATFPASPDARNVRGEMMELRILGGGGHGGRWQAVALGAGNRRTPTEHRASAPPIAVGDRLTIA